MNTLAEFIGKKTGQAKKNNTRRPATTHLKALYNHETSQLSPMSSYSLFLERRPRITGIFCGFKEGTYKYTNLGLLYTISSGYLVKQSCNTLPVHCTDLGQFGFLILMGVRDLSGQRRLQVSGTSCLRKGSPQQTSKSASP